MDELIFFKMVGQPPTSHYMLIMCYYMSYYQPANSCNCYHLVISHSHGKFSTNKSHVFLVADFLQNLKTRKPRIRNARLFFCIFSLHIVSFLVYGWPHAVWYWNLVLLPKIGCRKIGWKAKFALRTAHETVLPCDFGRTSVKRNALFSPRHFVWSVPNVLVVRLSTRGVPDASHCLDLLEIIFIDFPSGSSI